MASENTFFRFAVGFLTIIAVSVLIIIFAYYIARPGAAGSSASTSTPSGETIPPAETSAAAGD